MVMTQYGRNSGNRRSATWMLVYLNSQERRRDQDESVGDIKLVMLF